MAELRIVAGEWRGRRFKVPPKGVRPTSDRVREAWLSIVHPHLDGARVVDLCAGSGALGLEALSRGAAHCDFVETSAAVRRVLEANIIALQGGERAAVHGTDAVAFLGAPDPGSDPRWDVAFADPPYREGIAEALARRWLAAPFATIFGVEHEMGVTMPAAADGTEPDRRTYGDTAVTIYRLPTAG
jgi:16S rRNA (guanine966-N2)-methyltransferase